MKTKILLLAFLLTTTFANASHLMGGEITWTSPGNGQFVFHLKLYRDCNGVILLPIGIYLDVHNHPTLDTIPMHFVTTTDISPKCDSTSSLQISCATAFGSSIGAVEELVFISDTILLSGIPPTTGWIFSFSSCCRSSAISNLLNPSALGITLWAKMFSFQGQDVSTYSDNSPYFAEQSPTITCVGMPYSYNPISIDLERDSLVHSWAKPLDSWNGGIWNTINPFPIIFANGYSYMNQFPDSLIDSSSVAATINAATGEINLTSFTVGQFVSTISVAAYKCGIKVAEISRDFPLRITPCVSNNTPVARAPFIDTTGSFTLYADTVFAGDSVSFDMLVTDFDTLGGVAYQYITSTAKGIQFGLNFNQTDSGCLTPPCAIISQQMPHVSSLADVLNFGWKTSINHLGLNYTCAYMPNTYLFYFKFADSQCPVPASVTKTVSITVLPKIPKPAVTFDGTTLSCDSGFAGYQWYKNRFKIAGATSRTYNPTAKALYECRVLDSLFNGNYSYGFNVTSFTAIEDYKESTVSLNIYPNPVTNEFVIGNTLVLNHGNYTVNLFDVYGKKVLTTENQNKIAVEKLAAGIYLVELRTKNMVVRNRIIKNGK